MLVEFCWFQTRLYTFLQQPPTIIFLGALKTVAVLTVRARPWPIRADQGNANVTSPMQFSAWALLGSGRTPQSTSSFYARLFTTVVGLGPCRFLFIEGHPGFSYSGHVVLLVIFTKSTWVVKSGPQQHFRHLDSQEHVSL